MFISAIWWQFGNQYQVLMLASLSEFYKMSCQRELQGRQGKAGLRRQGGTVPGTQDHSPNTCTKCKPDNCKQMRLNMTAYSCATSGPQEFAEANMAATGMQIISTHGRHAFCPAPPKPHLMMPAVAVSANTPRSACVTRLSRFGKLQQQIALTCINLPPDNSCMHDVGGLFACHLHNLAQARQEGGIMLCSKMHGTGKCCTSHGQAVELPGKLEQLLLICHQLCSHGRCRLLTPAGVFT